MLDEWEPVYAPIVFTFLAFFTRLWKIGLSPIVTWDEAQYVAASAAAAAAAAASIMSLKQETLTIHVPQFWQVWVTLSPTRVLL